MDIVKLEWRTTNASSYIIGINDTGKMVTMFVDNDADSITHFLTAPGDLTDWQGNPVDTTTPEHFGDLVATRFNNSTFKIHDVSEFEYRIAFWFRWE